jgi:hypothetical protein
MLVLGLAAANDDPSVHGPTGTGGIEGNKAHLAWGAGRHVCPAQHPARLIVETAVETLIHRLPDLQLAVPAHELAWRPSPWSRALISLPVLYSAFTPPRRESSGGAGEAQAGDGPALPDQPGGQGGCVRRARRSWLGSVARWWSGR